MFVFELGIYDGTFEKKYKIKPKFTRSIVAETASKAKYEYFLFLDTGNPFQDFLYWVYCKKTGVANISHLFGDVEGFEWMKQHRGLPYIYRGMKVEVWGKSGVIVGANHSANLDVVFDGEWHKSNCHPYDETVYFDAKNNIVGDFRKKIAG